MYRGFVAALLAMTVVLESKIVEVLSPWFPTMSLSRVQSPYPFVPLAPLLPLHSPCTLCTHGTPVHNDALNPQRVGAEPRPFVLTGSWRVRLGGGCESGDTFEPKLLAFGGLEGGGDVATSGAVNF
jgi:hypothetical protein